MSHQPYYTKIVVKFSSNAETSYRRNLCRAYSTYKTHSSKHDDTCSCINPRKRPHPCDLIEGPDCCINIKKIKCCFIKGRVLCEFDGSPVPNAIVFATRQLDGKVFTGLTNRRGEYCICVPKGGKFTIQAFLCCDDCVTSAPCTCGEVDTCL